MRYPSFYLAWRYLKSGHTETTIALMSMLCFIGIVISTFSLMLVLFVMRGFEKETHAKLQGIHAQVIIRSQDDSLNYAAIAQVLTSEFKEVQAFSPTSIRQGLMLGPKSDSPEVVIIRGIDPETEAGVSSLARTIGDDKCKPIALAETVHDNQSVIGSQLAKTLGVVPGDTVTLLYAESEHARSRTITFAEENSAISGTFTTGIDEFDSTMMLCSLSFFNTLFPDAGIDEIHLILRPATDEQATIKRLKERLQLDVYSWKDLYPALVAALKLEKYAMLIIFSLIALVASMTIISLLFMHITQKRGDIAILKAMGADDTTIASIFLSMGMSIAAAGCMCGTALALLVGLLLQRYPLITLPDAYYVSHIPITIEWELILGVVAITMLLSFIATWIPAQKARSLIIAHVLRFEA